MADIHWLDLFEKHLHIVTDPKDPYYSELQTVNSHYLLTKIMEVNNMHYSHIMSGLLALPIWIRWHPELHTCDDERELFFENVAFITAPASGAGRS